METPTPETLIDRVMSELFNTGSLTVVDSLGADGLCVHYPQGAGPICGREAVRRAFSRARAAFPDAYFLIEETLASADRVIVRWTGRGTHTGPFWGLAPTGRQVTWSGMASFHIAAGRVAEVWIVGDALSLYQQLAGSPGSLPA